MSKKPRMEQNGQFSVAASTGQAGTSPLWVPGRPIQSNDPAAESNGAQLDELDIPVIQEGEKVPLTLEDAAYRILDELDPDHRRIINECSAETGQPASAYVLSAMRLSRDRNEISTLDRESMVEPEAQRLPESVTCAWCKQAFTPTKAGQYLCPEPAPGEESCARKMALDRLRNRRTRTVDEGALAR